MKGQNSYFQTQPQFESISESSGSKPENDFDAILERMKTSCLARTDKMLADHLEVQYSTITTSRRRGAVPASWLLTIADKFGVSVDWLRTGEGEMMRGDVSVAAKQANITQGVNMDGQHTDQAAEDEAVIIYNDKGEPFYLGEALAQAVSVLTSKTIYATALLAAIRAHHKAVGTEKKIDYTLDRTRQTVAVVHEGLDKKDSLIKNLQDENATLKAELARISSPST